MTDAHLEAAVASVLDRLDAGQPIGLEEVLDGLASDTVRFRMLRLLAEALLARDALLRLMQSRRHPAT